MIQPSFTTTLTVFTDPQLGGRTMTFGNGDVVCHEYSAADNVFYIIRGQVRLYAEGPNHSNRLIKILGPGEWFGVASLAGAATYQQHAVAVGSAVVMEV